MLMWAAYVSLSLSLKAMIFGIDSVHKSLNCDWYLAIAASTVVARVLLLPANVAAVRIYASQMCVCLSVYV